MQKQLWVFFNGHRAGTLACGRDGLSFQYEPDWLSHRSFVPLSVILPPRRKMFPHRLAYPYFENLLPEEKLRAALARARGIAEPDIFELLEKTGGDCTGAVSLTVPGSVPADSFRYAPTSARELKALIARSGRIPIFAADPGRRVAIAGSAQKTTVWFRRGSVLCGCEDAPTTHVLKPDSLTLPQSASNEAFCLELARRAGLNVAKPTLLRHGTRVLLIERSDRFEARGAVRRLHEIDFCQAANFPSHRKYEKDGGPGVARLFELASRHVSGWPRAQPQLLRWVLFNYLIGNRDTHAKNLSLTMGRARTRLAPFYDLICTAIYPEGEKELALAIGGQRRAHAVTRSHWRRFARDIEIEPAAVERAGRELAASLPKHADAVAGRLRLEVPEKRRIWQIRRFLAAQCRQLERTLADGTR